MKKIVIIEDEPIMQEYYNTLLMDEDYKIFSAYNGEEGLDKIIRYEPDLIILDLVLPGTDGRTLLGKIKKIDKNIPVFIVSGKFGMENDPEIEMNHQVYRFFKKPIDAASLIESLHSILNPPSYGNQGDAWIGKTINGYRLTEEIAQGNMSIVYKASRGEKLGVVKILKDSPFEEDREEKITRFRQEAKMLMEITHPNIIKMLDIGVYNHAHFLIMEYFQGEGVDKILGRVGRIEFKEASEIIMKIAEGMQVAHEQNLIHRDLKPSNILYNMQRKTVKIIDFGTGKKMHVEQSITQQGYVVGTPYYMSPEQCQGFPLDPRCDIYSLGATFYHLVTGTVPFDKPDAMQTLYAHVYEAVPWPPSYYGVVPPQIRHIISRMMAKKTKERFPDMKEVANELALFLMETSQFKGFTQNRSAEF